MSGQGARSFVVLPSEARERLDRVVSTHFPEQSRAEIQRWIEAGNVLVDGSLATASSRVREGATVDVTPLAPRTTEARPEDIPLAILYEDEHLLVVDKPAGLVVHPAPGHASGTLVNAYLHHVGGEADDEEADPTRPGIVHRLDRDTSGAMVIAKTAIAREGLMERFRTHDLERAYLGIVVGEHPLEASYDTLHGRHPRDRKRFTSKVRSGKRAVTHVERVEILRGASLVRCRLETGRTHQIRVHLSEHGFPLLGDPVYGKPPKSPALRALGEVLGRQALHAAVLGFPHPVTGVPLRFEAPLPSDLARALEALRSS
ncbi:MAG: RluA family pseudouridine synthase [Sandaracinus sp.]